MEMSRRVNLRGLGRSGKSSSSASTGPSPNPDSADPLNVTQSVIAIGRPDDWKTMERFAEVRRLARRRCHRRPDPTRLVEEAPGRLWYGCHVSSVDDTRVHR